MDRNAVYHFIGSQQLAVISTVDAAGRPEAALIGFAFDAALGLVFNTSARSRKAVNLSARPRAALVLGWDDETTVQMEGVAHVPTGAALARAKDLYFRAWPDGRAREAWPEICYFVIEPRWVRFSRYSEPVCLVEFAVPG